MKDKVNKIPAALQKQIILRFGMGILVFFLFIVVSIYYHNLYFSLPCFLLSFVLFAYGIFLFYNCIEKKYLILEGTCVEVLTKRVRKKIKSIILMVDGKNLKLPIQKEYKQSKREILLLCIYRKKHLYNFQTPCFLIGDIENAANLFAKPYH